MTARARTTRVRTLLLAGVVLTALVPAAIGVGTWFAVGAWQKERRAAHVRAAERLLVHGAGRYEDPSWQRKVRESLAALGVDVQIGSAGKLQKQSLLATGAFLDEIALKRAGASLGTRMTTLDLPDSRHVDYTATLLAPLLNSSARLAATLAAGAGAMLLVLTWLLLLVNRWIVRPLRGLGRAVDSIAGGATAEPAPGSRVREIDEVQRALVAMDASLRESADAQERADAERRFLISAIAHDLRTPLFILRGYLEAAQRRMGDVPGQLSRAQAKAGVLERLVSDLFTFSRAEYDGVRVRREELDLQTFLRQALDGFVEQAALRRVELSLAGAAGVTARADRDLLDRIVSNLVDNAVRHSPPGGRVEISWRRQNDWLTLEVLDAGPGIAEADLPHLFEPLYRGDVSRNGDTGGAGLGLAIARQLIEAHGGTIRAESPVTGGAVFTATLPAA